MPSSQWTQIGTIVDAIVRLDPRSVLDVGVGFGKYGFLAREYLELWDGRHLYGQWMRRIEGIEAHPAYLSPVQRNVYDRIHEGEAHEMLARFDAASFDLVLAIDILEHFERVDGARFLDECRRVGRWTLVSVPRVLKRRDAAFGNPYEAHKTAWSKTDLAGAGARLFLWNPASRIALFGDGTLPAAMKRARRWKDRLRLYWKGRLS